MKILNIKISKIWAIGTEMRQLTLNTPEMQEKTLFRSNLIDDVKRRHFIIDADVQTQTFDLMKCPPKPDEQGNQSQLRCMISN